MALLKGNDIDIISINGPPAFGKSSLAIHVGYSALRSGMNIYYIDVSESPQMFKETRSTEVSLLEHATNPDSQRNLTFKILMTSQIHITFLDRFQQILINGLDQGAAVQLLNK